MKKKFNSGLDSHYNGFSTLAIIFVFFPAENSETQSRKHGRLKARNKTTFRLSCLRICVLSWSIFLSSDLFGSDLSRLGNQLSTEMVEDKVVSDYSCKNCNSQNSLPTLPNWFYRHFVKKSADMQLMFAGQPPRRNLLWPRSSGIVHLRCRLI